MKLLTLLLLMSAVPAFAQTGDPSLDADAAKIRSSYISRDQITQGAVEKSSGAFDDALKSISDSMNNLKDAAAPTLTSIKDAVAPAINSAAETLGIDAHVQTEAERAALMKPVVVKPKDPLDIALDEINLKSEIAKKMNKKLAPATEELAKTIWETIPAVIPALKESAKITVNPTANTFTITASYADKNNSYNLTIHRDLNYSVVNTVFFNHLFFSPESPLGLRGLAGEEYYSKDCREGVINGTIAMVCYNQGTFHTYLTMDIAPSIWFGLTVGGKESMKKTKEFISRINPPKIAILAKDTKDSSLGYAEDINNIYFSEYKNSKTEVAAPKTDTAKPAAPAENKPASNPEAEKSNMDKNPDAVKPATPDAAK